MDSAAGALSSALRTIRGPRLSNYDLSVFRNFAIRERVRLEHRAEFCNTTNTPHFANPVPRR